MIFIIVGFSLLYMALAFILTEKNAKYLLSGYNTMSLAEQEAFDLKSYLAFSRKFHIFLSLTNLTVGLVLYFFISKDQALIAMVIIPLSAYVYFIWKSLKYHQHNLRSHRISLGVLITILLFISFMFIRDNKETEIKFSSEKIEMTGSYGEKLNYNSIKKVELTENYPALKLRINGYALAEIKKGYFKTHDGETIKLLINSAQTPVILITKENGKKIYFSSKSKSNIEIFEKLSRCIIP